MSRLVKLYHDACTFREEACIIAGTIFVVGCALAPTVLRALTGGGQ